MDINQQAIACRHYISAWRRHFHRHPEPSGQEWETARAIQAELKDLGIPFVPIAQAGILATITGKKPGPVIALRADMDALEITETATHEYCSRNAGLCHACGHDAHMAMLLGAAKILVDIQDTLRGTVKLLFQPAEESFGGARAVIAEGGLEGVDTIFGLHILGRLPHGLVSVTPGPIMAAANRFVIEVTGKSGHGGLPHEGVDAIVAASALVMNLQTIASREISPIDPVVVSVGRFSAGTRYNVIAGSARLEGTTRCFTEEINNRLPQIMERLATQTAATYRAEAALTYTRGAPPTVNDAVCAERARTTAQKVCGQQGLISLPQMTGAEDFSLYLQAIPGVFVFLGGANPDKGLSFPQHHDAFDIDEEALPLGAALYVQYAFDFLEEMR